jgi:hypothetical protein
MTASSGVVLGNLAYLIGAVVVAIIGGLAVWLHHRQPKSVDAHVESFQRGLQAIAPDSSHPVPLRSGPSRRQQGLSLRSPSSVSLQRMATPSVAAGDPAGADPDRAAARRPAAGSVPDAAVVGRAEHDTPDQPGSGDGTGDGAGAQTG